MAKKRLSTEQRRKQIIAMTMELLTETPLDALSTRQLAAALDLSQPALFRHFASKDALLVAVIQSARSELGRLANGLLSEPGTASEKLRGLVRGLTSYVERHPGLPRILFADLEGASPEVRAALEHLISMQQALVSQLVRDGQQAGEITRRVAPEQIAAIFVATLQGQIFRWQLDGRRWSIPDRGEVLYDLWLTGAVARSGERELSAEVEPVATERGARTLDVRPIISSGVDPLESIVAELDRLLPGSLLVLMAPFSPRPLLTLMASKGHGVETEELAAGTHLVTIRVATDEPIRDLRDLEPPEPLEAVLEASTKLGAGATWAARLPRFPRLLVPHLEKRPVRFELCELEDGSALIWLEGRT